MEEDHEVAAAEATDREEQAVPKRDFNDFGAEVRDLFEVISNDSLSPQLVKRIIAFKFGMKDCSDDLDDFYCDFLLQQARYDINFVKFIEDSLQHFIEHMNASDYDFRPMPAIKRKIIHELCVHYGCTSLSHGSEPDRFVRVTVDRDFHRLPHPKLSNAVH